MRRGFSPLLVIGVVVLGILVLGIIIYVTQVKCLDCVGGLPKSIVPTPTPISSPPQKSQQQSKTDQLVDCHYKNMTEKLTKEECSKRQEDYLVEISDAYDNYELQFTWDQQCRDTYKENKDDYNKCIEQNPYR